MRTAAAIAALFALGACAPSTGQGPDAMATAGGAPRACFFASQVNNFRQGDGQTIYIRSLRRDVFEIQSVGFCRDLDFANALAIVPETGSGERLCANDRVIIALRGGPASDGPCRARIVRRLNETEIAALPGRQRP